MTGNYDDIVITGAGLVSCLGLDRESTWRAVKAGRCGIGPLTAIESKLDPDKGGGQVADPEETAHVAAAPVPREVRLLRRAIREAMSEAGIDEGPIQWPCEPNRCAILLGTTLHGMRNGGAFLRSGDPKWLRAFLAGATLRAATGHLPAVGFTTTTCSACSSGLASLSLGHTMLQAGEADLVIAGGYDPISEYAYAGFNSMRLVSSTSLRPFDKTRDGMKIAEGYAVVVLERACDAAARHATPLARIAGYGESCDAHHLSKPHPEGAGAAAAMRQALTSAELQPSEIDMLIAHATATPDNDASEYQAMAQVFGDHLPNIPVVGLKSHLGHSLGAAGTIDLILATMAIRDHIAPTQANYDSDNVEFEALRRAEAPRADRKLTTILNTSLGFGGANACMIVTEPHPSADRPRREAIAAKTKDTPATNNQDVVITGVGVVLPGAIGTDALFSLLSSGSPADLNVSEGSIPPEQYEHLLNARRTRRMSGYAKLCLAATADAYAHAGITDIPGFGETCRAIVGTMHGAADYCHSYYRQLIDEGVNAANPMLFAEGVPNVASAHLSTTFSLNGFCQTLIGTRTAGLEALQLATARIRTGVWHRAVVCAVDDYMEIASEAYRTMLPGSECVMGSGAVAIILESRSSATPRHTTIHGRITNTFARTVRGGTARSDAKLIGDAVSELGPLDTIAIPGTHAPIDRIENLGLRMARRCRSHKTPPKVTTLYGQFPELFAVGPLASLAVAVCSGSRSARAEVPTTTQSEAVTQSDHAPTSHRSGIVWGDFHGSLCGVAVELE